MVGIGIGILNLSSEAYMMEVINTFIINREGRLSAIEVLDAMDWIYCRSITLLLASQD